MIPGIEFGAVEGGIKASGLDLGLVFFREEMRAFALYTRNRVKAAHILYDRRVDGNPVRALVVNSGCANACTGKEGVADLRLLARNLAPLLGITPESILFASTGVIGRRLPANRMVEALPKLVKSLEPGRIDSFARAIMTTDTFPKIVKDSFEGEKTYALAGVAKGAGMINPLFATMLSFVFTDFPASSALSPFFNAAGRLSFERVTVDGECSTNDTVMLFTRRGEDASGLTAFREKLSAALERLARMIVKDGEGATKVIHITVQGAAKKGYAEKIARRIATSPLTKTAFFGCDPNWGRVICAAGDAGVPLNPSRVSIIMQGREIVHGGMEVPFDEKALKKLMDTKEVELVVDLGEGKAAFDIFTTDLTYDYVKINASYRS